MDIPIRRIEVRPADLRRLEAHADQVVFVDGVLHRNGRAEPVRFGYRGNRTRQAPKKSFEIRRRGGTLHLNAEYDDPTMLRNALSFWFFRQIGVPSPWTQHCRLIMNEQDLGVYLEIEGVDATFFRRRRLGCRSLFYAVNHDADFSLVTGARAILKASLFDGYERVIGSREDQKRFERFIFDLNTLRDEGLRRHVAERIDTPLYLRWLAGAVCTGNADGLTQNYAVYESTHDGRYRFVPWDYEGTWGRNCFGQLCPMDTVGAFGENVLTTKVLGLPDARRAYRQLIRHLASTVFTEEYLVSVVRDWMRRIGPAVLADDTRRHAADGWAREFTVIYEYIRERRQFLLKAMDEDEGRSGMG
ncbi:MAG: CotH kinase family protein [Alicyclobacillus macrosporangiidus]|uniref:CotH kinase family protein n=1 Tax=Alicyclobacillus macrosporangiidus TaxID=392015 RepID=UPI0026ED7EB0|nr:CotH kinase family protein [Alicyclobacillus macrosporangiidus]MCL6598235.1 CotH kinase family protein [Alicyclobacillus macrosporangiidus]